MTAIRWVLSLVFVVQMYLAMAVLAIVFTCPGRCSPAGAPTRPAQLLPLGHLHRRRLVRPEVRGARHPPTAEA